MPRKKVLDKLKCTGGIAEADAEGICRGLSHMVVRPRSVPSS